MKEAKLQWAGTNRPKYSATLNRKGECWVLRRQMEWWQDGLSSPNGFNKLTDSFLPHTVFFPLYLPLFLLLFMSFISIGAGTKFGPLKTFFRWCHCSPRVVMGFCCWAGCQLLVVAHGSPPPLPFTGEIRGRFIIWQDPLSHCFFFSLRTQVKALIHSITLLNKTLLLLLLLK